MIAKEMSASKFAAEIFSIIGLSFIIFLAQSTLILSPKQHLYAAAGTHRDPVLTADYKFEQDADCAASSY